MAYRAALITGVNERGIGGAFASARALATTDLLLTGRRQQELHALARRLRGKREVSFLAANLCTPAEREMLIEAAAVFGIDLLICNAGMGYYGSFIEQVWERHRDTLALNVVAISHLIHQLIPILLKNAQQREGRAGVIVVSSTAANHPSPLMASYGAAKLFQTRLVETLAIELKGQPIDLLAICPSYTATGFFEKSGVPTGHLTRPMLRPEEVARFALDALLNAEAEPPVLTIS